MSVVLLAVLSCALVQGAPPDRHFVPITPEDRMEDIIRKAAHVTPSPRQLAWQKLEFTAFVHFGMNTFTDREWGEGNEDEKLFNPTDFDARQWVRAIKAAGIKLLIVTAKHHDGFCLWPSKYTEHCVRNSPWKNGKGDVVREVSDACREAGIKFGVYLSPWDRHEPSYGDSPNYNQYFKNQLTELLTNYGEIAEAWFDGACGEGPNGKRQEYDFRGYYDLIRKLQPKAAISIMGPDVRWCGNESGTGRESEWSVVPVSDPTMYAVSFDCSQDEPGSREALKLAAEKGAFLVWYPAQVDTSIRPGWFYHASEDNQVRSLDELLDIYYGSVGGNSQLLLNIPPDRRGRLHDNDVKRLEELGQVLHATFADDLAKGAKARASNSSRRHPAAKTVDGKEQTYWTTEDGVTTAAIEYDLAGPRTFNRAALQEYIEEGQRVEEFFLDAWDGSQWKQIARATTIGHKRLLRFDDVTAQRVRVRITQSRDCPTLSHFGLYRAPAGP